MAKHYLDELGLDKILFIPTNIPPHKSNEDFAGRKDRFNMLRLAIKPYDKFEVSDIEFKRDGKSYTYDTLLELKKIYKNDQLYFMMGMDQASQFDKWKSAKEISELVQLVAFNRKGYQKNDVLNDAVKDFMNRNNEPLN